MDTNRHHRAAAERSDRTVTLWAEQNLEVVRVMIDPKHAERLIARGAVDRDWILRHTFKQDPKPILFCRDINSGGDEIVDGNHTYVAVAAGWARGRQLGKPEAMAVDHPSVLAYGLTPEQWRQFVIPSSMIKSLGPKEG